MPSLLKASTGPFLISFADLVLILLFLSASSVHGASLREHRLRGSEPDSQRGDVLQASNADMLKALEYIESLRQRTDMASQQHAAPSMGYDESNMDDAQKLRALMLRLAANPMQSNDEEEEEEEEEGREDKSKELLRAVLSTLEQTEKASKPALLQPSLKDGAYSRVQQRQHSIRPHRKLPLMFEDEEDGEGDEEEDTDLEHESPFKRTKENVEEKYTPQNLATLQSVFDELDKLTSTKAVNKRQDEGDDMEEDYDEEEDNGMFNVRNVAYDDMGANWGPLQEQEEEEEEEEEEEDRRDSKHEANRGLNYADDNDEETSDDDEEEDDESYLVKRSKDPDDVANLVDYYLLKVLEKTEEEEQKRDIEEEERKRAESRAAQIHNRDNIDPQAIYQLIQISQKYQIPPEDLLDMLKTGDTDQDQEVRSEKTSRLSRAENKFLDMASEKKQKTPEARLYHRNFPDTNKMSDDQMTDETLNILGLGGIEDRAPFRKQKKYKSLLPRFHTQPLGRSGESTPMQRLPAGMSQDDYDDTLNEDELAAYLAAQMLAQYPKLQRDNKTSQKPDRDGQNRTGSFEQADIYVQTYMDSDKSQNEKRQSEGDEMQMQGFDNESVLKLLSYLKPESEDTGDQTAQGI